MAKTLTGLFETFDNAERAMRDLEAAGFRQDQISLVASGGSDQTVTIPSTESDAGKAATASATAGAIVGGSAALLASLGLLAIPGAGPALAAGWLAATLTGAAGGAAVMAAGGGLVGAMIHSDIPAEQAHAYAEGVKRGGMLIVVRSDEGMVPTCESVFARNNAVDINERSARYRGEGWRTYGGNADSFTSTDRTHQFDPNDMM